MREVIVFILGEIEEEIKSMKTDIQNHLKSGSVRDTVQIARRVKIMEKVSNVMMALN